MTARPPIENRFIFLLYLLARIAGFPTLLVYFLFRAVRDLRYFASFSQRLGSLPASFNRTAPGSIWLHAVSVGEVISAVQLAAHLRRANPAVPLYLSATTLAGYAVAQQKLGGLVDGIFFSPIDYVFAVRGVIRTIRPSVVVILETEIWPVLYREIRRSRCGLLVLNGRISDRAFPRYQRWKAFFAPVLALPHSIYTQTEKDADRYRELGAPRENVHAFGNLKYDAVQAPSAPPPAVTRLLEHLQPEAVWIAASTMPGLDSADVDEDDAVISAFRRLAQTYPRLLLIVAPRRPERFDSVMQKLRSAGIPAARRTQEQHQPALALPCALVLDTIGELASLLPLATVVFMGGTLARRGGHNVLEPAVCGKPIIVGPHMENFPAIEADFDKKMAWLRIPASAELAGAVDRLLQDPELRRTLASRAMEAARSNQGVSARAADVILQLQDFAVPIWRRRRLLAPLAALWRGGNRILQARNAASARSLNAPVICVGGISMGGTGKTPFVEMLAGLLRQQGRQPAILTRGYRRRSTEKLIVAAQGTNLATAQSGDEARIFLRAGHAHVGIGADRWACGKLMIERLAPDILLLDDGFQHRRLKRNLDIVLIDALDPFPGGDVFPAGFLREPLSGLARAGVFVIARAQPGRLYRGLRAALAVVNPAAPIFTARVVAKAWLPEEPPRGPVAAFCGLGNPASFWQTLQELGFAPVFTWTFDDHHAYLPGELQRLAYQARSRGARAVLTTEKDVMNLPPNAAALVAPLQFYWLKITTQVDREEELLRLIMLQ